MPIRLNSKTCVFFCRCGYLRVNMMSLAHPLSTENASKPKTMRDNGKLFLMWLLFWCLCHVM